MTKQEAWRLLPKTTVMWDHNPKDFGIVRYVAKDHIEITWNDVGLLCHFFGESNFLRHITVLQPTPAEG